MFFVFLANFSGLEMKVISTLVEQLFKSHVKKPLFLSLSFPVWLTLPFFIYCNVCAKKPSEFITAKSVCSECIFPASNACVIIDFKAELLRYKSNKSCCLQKKRSLNSMAICHFSSATHA